MMRETVRLNVQRLRYVALVAAPVNLAHIGFFYVKPVDGAAAEAWRIGIIASHAALLASMVGFGLLSLLLERQTAWQERADRLVQYAAAIVILAAGVAIAAIDQLVTTSITPFLVACTITALIFLLRPMAAFVLYVAGTAAFFFAMETVQQDPAVQLSNQVNGITVAATGFCLSLLLWRGHSQRIAQRRLIEEQKEELEGKNQELTFLATRDPLTGLFNRNEFTRLLDRELSRIRRHGTAACLLLLDIDRFKQINDRFGHPAGDEILIQLANHLIAGLREVDVLARWGGEEFIILLPETPLAAALEVAGRLRARVEESIFTAGDEKLRMTVSIGATNLSSMEEGGFYPSYERADRALYLAKDRGRNRVESEEALTVPAPASV